MGKFDNHIQAARNKASSGDLSGALQATDAALTVAREARIFRARLLMSLGRPREALEDIAAADSGDVPFKFLELRLGLEEELQLFGDARATLGRMIALAGEPGVYLGKRAMVQQTLGAFDAAYQDFSEAIALRPLDGELYRLRGALGAAQDAKSEASTIETALTKLPDASAAAAHFQFALAKILEDDGQYGRAFKAYRRGNKAMRMLHPFDMQTRLDQTAAVREAFGNVTPDLIGIKDASEMAPIFVTGMPRSGTTLVEQILSSHPTVTAGGEASIFSSSLIAGVGDPQAVAVEALDLSSEALRGVGESYASRMRERFSTLARLTDKSLQSLLLAGPVLSALPKAHIVVVTRQPQATALSLYKQVFRGGKQLFSYDLDDIRKYQCDFDSLVRFWTDRLPERFHVIRYEDVVTDPERTIRDLLERVELPFDPACLQPEHNDRPVQTLSSVTVREPIGLRALDFWKNYEAELG